MSENNIKGKTLSGFVWRFMERCGAQAVNFVVTSTLPSVLSADVYYII